MNLFLLLHVYFSVVKKAALAARMLELMRGEQRVSLSMAGLSYITLLNVKATGNPHPLGSEFCCLDIWRCEDVKINSNVIADTSRMYVVFMYYGRFCLYW